MKKSRTVARHWMLKFREGSKLERAIDLVGPRYSVGRGFQGGQPKVDIVVDNGDKGLSRSHFVLVEHDEGYAVQNDSVHGTLLNGEPVEGLVLLETGDRIEAGQSSIFDVVMLTDVDRRIALDDEVAAPVKPANATVASPRKPFHKSPAFMAIVGSYVLAGILVLAALGTVDTKEADPGDGPYLTTLLARRLRPATAPPPKSTGLQTLVEASWASAQAVHGGVLLEEGDHAYSLVRAGMTLLGALGHQRFEAAIRDGERIAKDVKDAKDVLERRLTKLHKDGADFKRARRYDAALECYRRICEAIPDREFDIYRFAVAEAKRMSERVGRSKSASD